VMPASIAVVVPTLNEAAGIAALIDSVKAQSYPVAQFIIADAGSTDGTREIATSEPTVTLVDNPDRHAAAGRNVALRWCTTDWVLFTDGDCRPAPDWAQKLMAAATSTAPVVGVGGRLMAEPRNVYETVCARMLLSAILHHDAGSRPITEKLLDGALVTANCAYRRDILDQVGGFDVRFSNFGEDIDLMFRVLDLDAGTLVHTADAVVVGDMPATLTATFIKWRQYGLASSHLNKYHYRRRGIDIGLYRRMTALTLAAVTSCGPQRTEALVGAAQLAAHIGGKIQGSLRLRTVNL
jgi:glycosyltransferase involved in cell wall biosynthesis